MAVLMYQIAMLHTKRHPETVHRRCDQQKRAHPAEQHKDHKQHATQTTQAHTSESVAVRTTRLARKWTGEKNTRALLTVSNEKS